MNPHLDYYAILGLETRATPAEIKRAFREKARRYHPDVNPDADAAERFKEINEAYRVLSDRRQRETYDARRLMLYGWGAGGVRGDRDPGVDEILRRWRSQPPPPRTRPPTSPFASRRSRARRMQGNLSFWLMAFSLMCLLLGTAWALSFNAVESEEAPPEAAVVLPTAAPTEVGPLPRRFDLWTVFGPDRLGYATLVYPEDALSGTDPVELSLPFQGATWDILIFDRYYGASRVSVAGEGDFDGASLFLLPDRPTDEGASPAAFGLYMELVGTSALEPIEDQIAITIPLEVDGGLAEHFIAIAVPAGSSGGAVGVSGLYEYVDEVSGWRIIFYDVLSRRAGTALRLTFGLQAPDSDRAPDPFFVETLHR